MKLEIISKDFNRKPKYLEFDVCNYNKNTFEFWSFQKETLNFEIIFIIKDFDFSKNHIFYSAAGIDIHTDQTLTVLYPDGTEEYIYA